MISKQLLLFILGALLFPLGIYLSLDHPAIGTALGVGGGMIMGFSSFFQKPAKKNRKQKRA